MLEKITKHIKKDYNRCPRAEDIPPGAPEELHGETAKLTTGVQAAREKCLSVKILEGSECGSN